MANQIQCEYVSICFVKVSILDPKNYDPIQTRFNFFFKLCSVLNQTLESYIEFQPHSHIIFYHMCNHLLKGKFIFKIFFSSGGEARWRGSGKKTCTCNEWGETKDVTN